MGIVVGFGCCLVVLAVTAGVTGLPEQQLSSDDRALDFNDDDIARNANVGKLDKRACTDLAGSCISLRDECDGELKIGKIYCRKSTKFGCCVPPPPKTHDCVMDGKVYANGDKAEDRCVVLTCNNGTWEFYDINYDCSYCELDALGDGDGYFSPYVPHNISGSIIGEIGLADTGLPNYNGSYTLTQSGLTNPAQLTVDVTRAGNCLTSVIYKEPGITVEFSFSVIIGAQLLVNGVPYPIAPNHFTSSYTAIPVAATFGTVYIVFIDGSWPDYGYIFIVGSQGIILDVYFDCDYEYGCCYVDIYPSAMPSLHNQLYGLCGVNPPEVPPYPTSVIKSDGSSTDNIIDFIDSWKLPRHRRRYEYRAPIVDERPSEKRSNIGVEKSCEEKNKGPCKVLRPEACKRLNEACVSHMSGSIKRGDASK